MNNQAILTDTFESRKSIHLSIINKINKIIKREEKNAIGITLMYVMVGSGIASLTAALAVNGAVSVAILILSASLAMGTNAAVLSQQTFKTSSWFFIVNVVINSALLIYQALMLL